MNSILEKSYWADAYKSLAAVLSQQGLDIQLLLVSLCILVAILSSKLLQRILVRKYPAGSSNAWIANRVAPEVLTPALVLFALMLATWIGSLFVTVNKPLIVGVLKIALAWAIARMLLLLSKRHFVAYVIGGVIVGVTLLDVTKLLTPALSFLENIKLETSTFQLSLLGIVKGVFTLVIVFWGAGALAKTGESWIRSLRFSFNARELSVKFLRIALYFVAIVITLNQMGVDLTAFTIFGGALGVGLGFGLQKITSNFISGIILLFEKTIVVGDLIEVGSEKGWVRQMAIRHTLIETFDGREMLIPNEDLIIGKVTNWTYTNTRARAEIILTTTYAADAEKVMELLLTTAKQNRKCLSNPEPICVIKEFTDKGIQYSLSFWIADIKTGLGIVRSDVMRAIVQRFKEVEIAFAVSN